MNEEKNTDAKMKTGDYHAPWEKSFDKILTPFEEFIHRVHGELPVGGELLIMRQWASEKARYNVISMSSY